MLGIYNFTKFYYLAAAALKHYHDLVSSYLVHLQVPTKVGSGKFVLSCQMHTHTSLLRLAFWTKYFIRMLMNCEYEVLFFLIVKYIAMFLTLLFADDFHDKVPIFSPIRKLMFKTDWSVIGCMVLTNIFYHIIWC